MPSPLSNPEMVLLQQETNYLNSGIPIGGSVVVNWNGMYVLIYHSAGAGYQTTDVSDLPSSTISQLAAWTPAQGALYFVPQEVAATIEADAEEAVAAAKAVGAGAAELAAAVAAAVGDALNKLLKPIADALLVPLVLAAVVLVAFYLPKHQ